MKRQILSRLTPLALAMAALPALAVQWQKTEQPLFDQATAVQGAKKEALKAGDTLPNRYIIELQASPLARLADAPRTKGGRIDLASSQSQGYLAQLRHDQNQVASALTRQYPGAKVTQRFDTLFNGLVVQGENLDPASLKSISGVKRVYPDRLMVASYDASLPLVGAPAVWEAVGGTNLAGKGIKVAVIDSGIRPENPMFADAGYTAPTGLPDNDYCHTVDASFCNNKLILARSYPALAEASPNEYKDSPLGYDSHGSHVAGIAVGNPVSLTRNGATFDVAGVAPGAYLMVYKALFSDGEHAYGATSSLMQALVDAVNDGADVINNSWGGGPGGDPADSPYSTLYKSAEEMGVVVVTAAGNDGNSAQTIGCPACSESGITVANTQTGRVFANALTVDGNSYDSLEGGTVALSGLDQVSRSGTLVSAAVAVPANPLACDSYSAGTFNDQWVLVDRGECTFDEKATKLIAAGAKGLVMANNDANAPFAAYAPSASVPLVMVSKADGELLTTKLLSGGLAVSVAASQHIVSQSQWLDAMNDSSSRGPNGDSRVLKPDLAAPGTDIISAASPDTMGQFASLTGTSMASPAVAGAAALVKAAHPDWSAVQVKAALTTTANPQVKDDDGISKATPFAMGAGRLDVALAVQAGLSVAPVSLVDSNCVIDCELSFNAQSLAGAAVWQGKVTFDNPAVIASLDTGESDPSQLTLTAGGSQKEVTLKVDTASLAKDSWYFGAVTWQDKAGQHPDARMAVAIYNGSQSQAKVLTMSQGSELGLGNSQAGQLVFTNRAGNSYTDLTMTVPPGLWFDGAPSQSSNFSGILTRDPGKGTLSFFGNVSPGDLEVKTVPQWVEDLPSLSTVPEASGFACSSNCDDGSALVTLAGENSFAFLDIQATAVDISFNGYLAFNGARIAGQNMQFLPSEAVTGALLAPFWGDLRMNADSRLYSAVLTQDGSQYQVFEWYKMADYQDTAGAKPYSFQVIVSNTGGQVYVHYLDLSDLPDYLVTGAQDSTGLVGVSLYARGSGQASGTAPTSNSAYLFQYQPAGKLVIDYSLAAAPRSLAISLEQDSSTSLDLTQGLVQGKLVVNAEVDNLVQSNKASSLWQVEPQGAVTALIATQPAQGTANLDGQGKVTYTPKAGFSGSDRFGYRLTDAKGNTSLEGQVSVTVTAVGTTTPDPDTGGNGGTTEQPSSGGGGGALGWLALLLVPLAWGRRRRY
ncbi:S8 family serine peptidase [Gallaecimonas xiamenensis]|uniref:Peptidase S8/S53 subtilisin kexin sedolisin n=1 Tax=Gallaecimonas xiamenensis 3-C-1 TaxID=745411 RepID=K2J3G5_9GAMM|nr:S8 family serine peptidase [Gallaecimonas xiamenensis]EKE77551.1 peptidase S8/S53 subtilisin kexin sedolisin [Gallaecimonas xiamenensis 3-C-1]